MLYWRETTDAQPFETGIQRVTRQLAYGLVRHGVDVVPVGWDPVRRLPHVPADRIGSVAGTGWLVLPEIPMSVLCDDLDPIQFAHAYGLRAAAIVHDLIPVRLPHLYDPHERTVYRRYVRMFAAADLAIATTELVAGHLRSYLATEGLPIPPIAVIPLPGQFAMRSRVQELPARRRVGDPLRLLAVSSFEPRKNLPRLLRAVRQAQEQGRAAIQITLVGRRPGYADHEADIDRLLAMTAGATSSDCVDDDRLMDLYARHDASVYPSCEEGFGMPVLESLWMGRPCLCHAGSAMAEVAPGGGTLMLDMRDESAIATALLRLAGEPPLLDRLTGEALVRPLRTWDEYAVDVASVLR